MSDVQLKKRLDQYFNQKVQVSRPKKKEVIAIWEPVVEEILAHVRIKDSRFSFSPLLYGGSFYERTKIKEPNEFDVMLKFLSLKRSVVHHRDRSLLWWLLDLFYFCWLSCCTMFLFVIFVIVCFMVLLDIFERFHRKLSPTIIEVTTVLELFGFISTMFFILLKHLAEYYFRAFHNLPNCEWLSRRSDTPADQYTGIVYLFKVCLTHIFIIQIASSSSHLFVEAAA